MFTCLKYCRFKRKISMAKEKRETCIGFLRKLYTEDPLVSNERALKLLLAHFPRSNANVGNILMWKKTFRDEGIKIPKYRK